jgi:hypothetical protein
MLKGPKMPYGGLNALGTNLPGRQNARKNTLACPKRGIFSGILTLKRKVILNKKPILGILTRPGQFKFLIAG